MEKVSERSVKDLVTGATSAMIAITAFVLCLFHENLAGNFELSLMLGSCASATILVMSALQTDLQRLYDSLAAGEQLAREDARRDSLTSLGNRKFLFEELERRCSQLTNSPGALLIIDLDNFKRINDSQGHQYGDELIAAVASRLKNLAPNSAAARLGGDEFALIVPTSADFCPEEICKQVVAIFDDPFELTKGRHMASGSVGACLLDANVGSSQNLRRADLALYQAKSLKTSFCVFDDELGSYHDRRSQLANDFRECLRTGNDLFAHFQTISTLSGDIHSLEALLRWRHPTLGFVPPSEIVSVAEEMQLIHECGRFMAHQAIGAAQKFPQLQICLNVSKVQLLDKNFASWLERTAIANSVSPKQIVIEVREMDFNEQRAGLSQALGLLSEFGFPIAVDNFGTSISSLADLKKRGVTIVKLDRRLLHAAQRIANITILRATVELAKALGMEVICTGVDSAGAESIARQAGCDRLQGFYISEPKELVEVTQLHQAA